MEYKCSICNSSGCKLWRDYNTFLDNLSLYCLTCASKHTKEEVTEVTPEGKIPWYFKSRFMGYCDQIGSLVPAVPTEDNTTFWGYTSVPAHLCIWWKKLPNYA